MFVRSFTPLLLGLVGLLPGGQPVAAQSVVSIPVRAIQAFEITDTEVGYVYRIDAETLKATRIRIADVTPLPPGPGPAPQPPTPPNPPAPVVSQVAWACLFVSPARTDAQWLDSEEIRAVAAERGIQFRGFRSTESEVDELGFRPILRQTTVPAIVLMDKAQDGKARVILSRKVDGLEDVIKAIREGK